MKLNKNIMILTLILLMSTFTLYCGYTYAHYKTRITVGTVDLNIIGYTETTNE